MGLEPTLLLSNGSGLPRIGCDLLLFSRTNSFPKGICLGTFDQCLLRTTLKGRGLCTVVKRDFESSKYSIFTARSFTPGAYYPPWMICPKLYIGP